MSKKNRENASRGVEDAVAKQAKKIQEDKNLSQAEKDRLLASNAKALDEMRKKMGTD